MTDGGVRGGKDSSEREWRRFTTLVKSFVKAHSTTCCSRPRVNYCRRKLVDAQNTTDFVLTVVEEALQSIQGAICIYCQRPAGGAVFF